MKKLANIFLPNKFGNPNSKNGTPRHHQHILKEENLSEETMSKPLTVTLHIGGKQVDTLTPEQREKMAQRLSEVMSAYYTSHAEEFRKIKN
jgi:hypothetical protein